MTNVHGARVRGTGRVAKLNPIVVILSVLGLAVAIGAIWVGFAASTRHHPGRPAIDAPAPADVVSGSTSTVRARPSGQ